MFKKTASAVVLLMVSGVGYAMDYQDTDPHIFPTVPIPQIIQQEGVEVVDENGFRWDSDSEDPTPEEKRTWAPQRSKIKKSIPREKQERLRQSFITRMCCYEEEERQANLFQNS